MRNGITLILAGLVVALAAPQVLPEGAPVGVETAKAWRAGETTAKGIGRIVAQPDCGRAWDWNCVWSTYAWVVGASRVGDHSWDIYVYYNERRPWLFGSTRGCRTRVRVLHYQGTKEGKLCWGL